MKEQLREDKVERSIGKSKEGEMYEVGSRYLVMCESVKEYVPNVIEGSESELEGSLMKKLKEMRKRYNP